MGMLVSPYRNGIAGPTDPNFANVILLMGFEGQADGSTTMVDEAPSPYPWAANGSAQVDTAQSKFGSASLLQLAATPFSPVTAVSNSRFAFGSGDFTIEGWIRFNSLGTQRPLIASWNGTNPSGKDWVFQYHSSNVLAFNFYTAGGTLRSITGAWTPSTATWYHIAVTRSGNDFRLFVNGTQVGSTATYSDALKNVKDVYLGWYSDNTVQFYNDGWIDEIRMTKGVARYTANFTAPTAAFPRS